MPNDICYEVTEMAVPERESHIDYLHIHKLFVSKQGLIYSGRQPPLRTWSAPPPVPPSRTTRASSAGVSPLGPRIRTPPPPSPTKRSTSTKKVHSIVIYRLVSIFHCPKTLTEGEIEKEEILFTDLHYQPRPTTNSEEMDVGEAREKVITVDIDFYIDKFGIFRTTHRSVGGMYMFLHNQNHRGRDQPRNHFVLGFTPNGASTQESCIPLVEELRELAKTGFQIDLPSGK